MDVVRNDAQWWTPTEVRAHPTDANNLLALAAIERKFFVATQGAAPGVIARPVLGAKQSRS